MTIRKRVGRFGSLHGEGEGEMGHRSNDRLRLSSTAVRAILLIASVLVFLAGIQLFVLTEVTDRFFAWTIKAPLTAAFLGAAYWASFAMEFYASRQRIWAHARIAVPAVLVFTGITFLISLVHIDSLHLNEPSIVTRFLTWGWLVVYAVVPPLMIFGLFRQVRVSGVDPPGRRHLPGWFRALLIIHAALLLPVGAALLLAPSVSSFIWPWTLTPLTAPAIGAWLVGIGIAAIQAVGENDWRRIQPATMSYVAFGALELMALARFPGEVAWNAASAWIFILFLVSALGAGLYGCWQSATLGRQRSRGLYGFTSTTTAEAPSTSRLCISTSTDSVTTGAGQRRDGGPRGR